MEGDRSLKLLEKICNTCGVLKPRDAYYKTSRDGMRGLCKPCYLAKRFRQLRSDPIKWAQHLENNRKIGRRHGRKYQLKNLYSLSMPDYTLMKVTQNGHCFICGEFRGEKLVVDHNHRTRAVRKLLCQRCNTFVGFVETRPDLLSRVLDYVNGGQICLSK